MIECAVINPLSLYAQSICILSKDIYPTHHLSPLSIHLLEFILRTAIASFIPGRVLSTRKKDFCGFMSVSALSLDYYSDKFGTHIESVNLQCSVKSQLETSRAALPFMSTRA